LREPRYRSLAFMGFPDYEVGDDGSVWSYQRGKRKRMHPSAHRGYLWVKLSDGGFSRPRQYPVHRLVLLAFVGPCPPRMQCRHFPDPDGMNNRLENLQWGTSAENHRDRLVQPRRRSERRMVSRGPVAQDHAGPG